MFCICVTVFCVFLFRYSSTQPPIFLSQKRDMEWGAFLKLKLLTENSLQSQDHCNTWKVQGHRRLLMQVLISFEVLFEYTARRKDGGAVRNKVGVKKTTPLVSFSKRKRTRKDITFTTKWNLTTRSCRESWNTGWKNRLWYFKSRLNFGWGKSQLTYCICFPNFLYRRKDKSSHSAYGSWGGPDVYTDHVVRIGHNGFAGAYRTR